MTNQENKQIISVKDTLPVGRSGGVRVLDQIMSDALEVAKSREKRSTAKEEITSAYFKEVTYESGESYSGWWKDDKYNGLGTYTWASGQKYVGDWKDGKQHGHGTLMFPDGSLKGGKWKNDVLISEEK